MTTNYEKNLDKLAALLRTKALTVKELAAKLDCCKPTVYARIAALKKRGDRVYSLPRAADGTGPRPLAYGITA